MCKADWIQKTSRSSSDTVVLVMAHTCAACQAGVKDGFIVGKLGKKWDFAWGFAEEKVCINHNQI